MLHILQVTDCHLLAAPGGTLLGVCCRESLQAVLHTACAERVPDAIVATGDLGQEPVAETYRLFLATLRGHFEGPLLCVPGNHDHGETFAAELPTEDLTLDGWRIVGIDTHVDDEVGGNVSAAELDRLRGLPKERALAVGHHCPVATGCTWLDEHRIDNGEDLLAALRGIRAYAFGHIHQTFEYEPPGSKADVSETGETALFGTPSTCFQFGAGATFSIDHGANPGYRWLHLADDGEVTTEVGRADFPLTIDLTDRDHQ